MCNFATMNGNDTDSTIKIDIDAVLRERIPRYHRFIPRFIIRKLENIVCQDQLNEMLRVNSGKTGPDFCRGVIDHLNIHVDFRGEHNLPADSRVVIVSNHPLGGLDGMIYIDYIARRYGIEPRFVVNDLLMAVSPLREVFLPVNKHGRQSRDSLRALDDALAGDRPVIIFPAGLVSRRSDDGGIADLRWQKMFVNKCKEFKRPVIPAFFYGQNSSFFYNFAKFRTKIGLKFNIEMVYLPSEVFKSRNACYSVTFGVPISWETLEAGNRAQTTADDIKRQTYALKPAD